MFKVSVGHGIAFGIQYLDQNGNPMKTAPTPDSPPAWTDTPSAPGLDTFTPAADGSAALMTAVSAGSDTVGLSVVVGGKTFTASASIEIDPAPQVLTSVAITADVQ